MDIQTGYIVTLLTTLLTGGIFMILFENLHLESTLSERFYNKMSPFMHKLTCYVRFVNKMSYVVKYKDLEQEYVKDLKDIMDYITKYNTPEIVSGKDIKMSSFTAKSLYYLCEFKINNVWYYVSEKYSEITPYIEYRQSILCNSEQHIKELLNNISIKYESQNIDIFLLSNVSGDFYTDVYIPISNVYFEYEYWKNESTKQINLTFILLILTLLSILMIIFLGNILCFWIYAGLSLVCSFYFVYLVYKMVQIYKNSVKLVQ